MPLRRNVLSTIARSLLNPRPGKPATKPHIPRQRPYLFTQYHRDNLWWWNGTWLPQTVPNGARIQIQLPGGPIRWIPGPHGHCRPTGVGSLVPLDARTTPLGRHVLPGEKRIPGTSNLQVFDYRVNGLGATAICLHPHPTPDTPEQLGLPPGSPTSYVLTLLVGIPQSELSLPLPH
ncbi:hypothetical protein [Streptomyces halobius]|uniref:Multicopper oxidase n=1 Tax=Streptomyces halobius TaxID=2879846 RepID=A0ABY4M033_9ACTN|nr:hypothetical protein [Streptomyces halobius]UQA91107.1 hypothetical protein K9S39_03700 [Streptomyces halobius]